MSTAVAEAPRNIPAISPDVRSKRLLSIDALSDDTGALFVVSAFYISFYPSIGSTPAMQEMIDSMPEGVAKALGYDQITSAAGYIGALGSRRLRPMQGYLLVMSVGTMIDE